MDRDEILASIIPLLTVLTIELATKTMSFHYFFSKSNLTDLKVVPVLECCGLSGLHPMLRFLALPGAQEVALSICPLVRHFYEFFTHS